jgi:uncharacterized membrane protein
MKRKKKSSVVYYTLVSNLYYPALLGAFFYILIDNFSTIDLEINKFIYLLSLLLVVVSFSIDYLYTIASKSFYSLFHFIGDIFIIFFLFLGYKNLIEAINNSSINISQFFFSFIAIHLIFIFWDLFFTPKLESKSSIIAFDIIGLVFAISGYLFFNASIYAGAIFLLLHTIAYFYFGLKYITSLLNNEPTNESK